MNDENVKFLKDSLFYLGFGDKLNEQLLTNMEAQKPEFNLQFSKEQAVPGRETSDKMQYELHFKKGKEVDMYFFNSYTAKLTDKNNENKEQLFYVNKNKGVTTKEAYNLLSGRAINKNLINKEGERYNAWLQLDFSKKDDHGKYMTHVYHEKHKFSLSESLAQLPIKGKEQGYSESLLYSLKKGNLTPVTFTKEDKEFKRLLAANPQYKNIDVYDEKGNHLFHTKSQKQEVKEEKKEKAPTQKATTKKVSAKGKKKSASIKTHKPRTRVAETASGKSLKK